MEINVKEDQTKGLTLKVEMWCDGEMIVRDEEGYSLDKEDLFYIIKNLHQENADLKEDLLSIKNNFNITPEDVWL